MATTPASDGPPALLESLSWRHLAARLRERGIARGQSDSRADLLAKLRAAEAAASRGALAGGIAAVLHGHPDTVALALPAVRRLRGRRVAPGVLLLPPGQLDAAIALLRRGGLELVPAAVPCEPQPVLAGLEPALWAAAQLVLRLGTAQGWRADRLPAALRTVPAPADAASRRQAQAWLRAWLAELEEAPGEAPVPVTPPAPPAGDVPAVIALLEQAVAEQRCVALSYRTADRGWPSTRRTVEPHALERGRGTPLLQAWCRWREAELHFRLDRITAAELLDERFGHSDDA